MACQSSKRIVCQRSKRMVCQRSKRIVCQRWKRIVFKNDSLSKVKKNGLSRAKKNSLSKVKKKSLRLQKKVANQTKLPQIADCRQIWSMFQSSRVSLCNARRWPNLLERLLRNLDTYNIYEAHLRQRKFYFHLFVSEVFSSFLFATKHLLPRLKFWWANVKKKSRTIRVHGLNLGDKWELVGRKWNLGKISNSAKSLLSSNQFLFFSYHNHVP